MVIIGIRNYWEIIAVNVIMNNFMHNIVHVCMHRLLKNSLLTIQHYDDWKDRRRTLDQAFVRRWEMKLVNYVHLSLCSYYTSHSHFSYLRGLVPVYNSVVKRDLIEALREKADGTTKVLFKTEISRVSLQVISEVS